MQYREFTPGEKLKPYIKCYYVFEGDALTIEDTVFPGGHLEIIFNLGEGIWETRGGGAFQKTPRIELWGKLTRPLPVRSHGKNKMLGVKFYDHSAACFLKEHLSELNDHVFDAHDLMGNAIHHLHVRLLETTSLLTQISLIESFFLNNLLFNGRNTEKINLIGRITQELQQDFLSEDIKTLAAKHKMTPRYLQKLFLQYTGVTPKFYHKMNRFQRSLNRIARRDNSLTTIAYDCGYFDQSHFVREFKMFTGITPSAYVPESFPVSVAINNN
jgi:AraC-like DNA-binding protein